MKKQILLLALLSIFSISIYAQNVISQNRSVSSFSGIKACCGINVYLSEGNSNSITVKAASDIIDKVTTQVKGNTLTISIDNKWNNNRKNKKIEVYVKAQNLTLIEASSGADIKGETTINARDIKLASSSSGDIIIDLKANNINGSASSGGDLNVTGRAEYAKLSASSGGDVNMKGMTVSRADANASSGGDVSITVKDEINAKASSGGDVNYYGNPNKVNKSAGSGGGVNRK